MDFRVFSLGSNDGLAKKIAEKLGTTLGAVKLQTFSDGEQYVRFEDNLRGKHVFLIQPTNSPAENWVRLLLAIDAARGASASEITAVVPYYGYARQDRKARSREPISARVFAMTLESLGAARLVTMDLHTDAIVGFFRNTIVDNLYARRVFIPRLREVFKDAIERDDLIVVSPDAGGVARAQSYAKRLMKRTDLAIIHKEREIPNQVARMKLIGEVKDKIALIPDDIVTTGGTLVKAAELLMQDGAREVHACVTHGVLSGDANSVIDQSPITKLFITDTIATDRKVSSKIEVVSAAEVFAEAIERIEKGESLSELFETE